jgi:predicted RNase H-like HicB family nuclease
MVYLCNKFQEMKKAELTMLVEKDQQDGLYVGQVEEFPAVISQGRTLAELKTNISDALKEYLEAVSI